MLKKKTEQYISLYQMLSKKWEGPRSLHIPYGPIGRILFGCHNMINRRKTMLKLLIIQQLHQLTEHTCQ